MTDKEFETTARLIKIRLMRALIEDISDGISDHEYATLRGMVRDIETRYQKALGTIRKSPVRKAEAPV